MEKSTIITPYLWCNNGDLFWQLPWKKAFKERFKFGRESDFDLFDIPEFLEEYRKEDFSHTDLSDYSVTRHLGNHYFGEDWGNIIYGDTKFQFVLGHKDKFVACVGFEPVEKKRLLVSQIQGVKGRQKALRPIRWTNALLDLTTRWASDVGFLEVLVLPGERNRYHNPVILKSELNGPRPSEEYQRMFTKPTIEGYVKTMNRNARLKTRYNQTAENQCFEYDSERKVYCKAVA